MKTPAVLATILAVIIACGIVDVGIPQVFLNSPGGGSGSSGANPTASVGLSAVNGSAPTFMRSDAAPALSQAITPTWTGQHLWNAPANEYAIGIASGSITSGTLGFGLNVAGTVNDASTIKGAAFYANVTCTSCGASSMLEVDVGGSDVFDINSLGQGTFAGTVRTQTNLEFAYAGGNACLSDSVSALLCSNVPTVSGTGLGTSPTVNANSNTGAMDITVGSSPSAASFTITLPTASTGWACQGSDITTESTTDFVLKQIGGTTTTAVMELFSDTAAAAAPAASDHYRISCGGL